MSSDLLNLVLDPEAAAAATGVGASTIRRWVKQGLLRPIRRKPVTVSTAEVYAVRAEATRRRLANLRPE